MTLSGGRLSRAALAQDAHTQAEQTIYLALWNAAAQGEENHHAAGAHRDVTIGTRQLMTRAGLSERAVQLNLKTLQLKLAVEIVDPGDATRPKTYRVHSAARILERRAAAGLEWIQTKQGGGVRLIAGPVSKTPGVSDAPGVLKAT